MIRDLRKRLRVCEQAARTDGVVYVMPDGKTAAIPRRQILTAMDEAVRGLETRRGSIMRTAVSARDGSELHTLAQALHAGPKEQ